VGAFADGMAGLRERGLIEPVRQFAASRRPLLGICLGMQMLLSSSEEFGQHEGLGLIAGRVLAIPSTGIDGAPHKIPHIGWAGLEASQGAAWDGSILRDVRPGSTVYMVHSYTAVPDDLTHRLADCRYDGRLISAAIRAGEVYGCQFHPEKSGPVGLRILATFLEA
jgi:imidazole glycerol-phosphate synthase subunit HisH